MEVDAIITLLEHGGLAAILYLLLMRVMNRLDVVTDKLLEMESRQRSIQAQLDK